MPRSISSSSIRCRPSPQIVGAPGHASRHCRPHRSPAQSGRLAWCLRGAFDLQGHRGARGLAPENTLAAFRAAVALGVTTLETDLAVTKDDVLVISHDPMLNPDLVRGPDGKWITRRRRRSIRSPWPSSSATTSAGSIRRASTRSSFPSRSRSTANASRRWRSFSPRQGRMCASTSRSRPTRPSRTSRVDPDRFAQLAVEAIRLGKAAGRSTIQSFDWRGLIEAHRLAPEIATGCLSIESNGMDTVGRASGRPSPWLAGLDLAAHGGSVPRLAKAGRLRRLVAVLAQRHGRRTSRKPRRLA